MNNNQISQKDLFSFWDKNCEFENTCTQKEGENIINLIKHIPNIYSKKIIFIIKFYLESIDKLYMLSHQVLEIYNYIKNSNINILHILYGTVRDFWNILEVNGHDKVAICYHNTYFDLYDSENYYLNKVVSFENNLEPFVMNKKIPYLFKIKNIDFDSEAIEI